MIVHLRLPLQMISIHRDISCAKVNLIDLFQFLACELNPIGVHRYAQLLQLIRLLRLESLLMLKSFEMILNLNELVFVAL